MRKPNPIIDRQHASFGFPRRSHGKVSPFLVKQGCPVSRRISSIAQFLRWRLVLSILVAALVGSFPLAGAARLETGATVTGWNVGLADIHANGPLTNVVALSPNHCLGLNADGTLAGCEAGLPSLTNVVAVSRSELHSLAVLSDGSVSAWGNDTFGQSTPPFLTNAVGVAAGEVQSLAILRNGRVTAWGRREFNQANIINSVTDAQSIVAGQYHSMILRSNGTVVGWGRVPVPNGLSNIVELAAGTTHSIARRTDGTVIAWGDNQSGQLNIPEGLSNVVQVAAGIAFSAALLADGRMVAWGDRRPVAVASNLLAIAAGYENAFGLTRWPVLLRPLSDRTVLAGTNVEWVAEVASGDPVTYQWVRSGLNLTGETNRSLVFQNVQTNDASDLSIIVRNRHGQVESAPARLRVQANPPVFRVQPPAGVQLRPGTNFVLNSQVSGAEPIFYQWHWDGSAISGATNASLELVNVSTETSGSYRLTAQNRYGTTVSRFAAVTVVMPPTMSASAELLTVPEGTNFLLRAVAEGTPTLAYQWLKDGAFLPNATNASLPFLAIQPGQSGNYSIRIRNTIGTITGAVATVVVQSSAPGIITSPESRRFQSGRSAHLTVVAYGSPPLSFEWYRDGQSVSGQTNSIFFIDQAFKRDAGVYHAVVRNAFGTATSLMATLSVEDSADAISEWPRLSWSTPVFQASSPVDLVNAGDGSRRLFVVELGGRVRVWDGTNSTTTLFCDLSDQVLASGEQGLLSMAFPPEGWGKNQFYLSYNRKADGGLTVSRFTIGADGLGDAASEEVLLTSPPPAPNSVGGQIRFSPEGLLYIGVGDASNSLAQSPDSFLGKLLRIDVLSGETPYRVPTDNPLVGQAGARPEVWSWGLRHPRRFSFDPVSEALYLADSGATVAEELNWQPSETGGQNYGWPIAEGSVLKIPGADTNRLSGPIVQYGRGAGSKIVGGLVGRSGAPERMRGIYFFADATSGRFWGLAPRSGGWRTQDLLSPDPARRFSTFGQDDQGQLYIADSEPGRVFRIDDATWLDGIALAPGTGSYGDVVTVAVTFTNPAVRIHYTTDGRSPTELDPFVYSGAVISVTNSTSLRAQAFRIGAPFGLPAAAAYTLAVTAPVFGPASGAITNQTRIAISATSPGATIRYTLDGTTPGRNSPLYAGPLSLNGNTTVKARAFRPGFVDSPVQSVTYAWARVATPVFSPTRGPQPKGSTVAISVSTPGAVIYFSQDPTEPISQWRRYSAPLVQDAPWTLRAYARLEGWDDSATATGYFGISDYEPTVVSTLAGTGEAGTNDGPAHLAQFYRPQGIAIDARGRLYVADTWNSRIRRIDTNGFVTTVAGSGVAGDSDGPAGTAQFNYPTGVAVDGDGIIYVADANNNSVRRIDSVGFVTTLARVRVPPAGPSLYQIEVSPQGEVFVGSFAALVKVLPNGSFATLAGVGSCCPTVWSETIGVGLQPDGHVLASMGGSHVILRISPSGQEELFAGGVGGYSDGHRSVARFEGLTDVAVGGDGNVYVSELTRIRKIRPDGTVTTLAGSGLATYANGTGSNAAFHIVGSLCVDARGTVYAADSVNHRIRRIQLDQDRDSVPDIYEAPPSPMIVGLDDRRIDSDGDGMSNADEFHAGTDPSRADSRLRVAAAYFPGEGLHLTWHSVAGRNYRVEVSASLATWSVDTSAIRGTGDQIEYVANPVPGVPVSRYYRVVAEAP